MSGSPPDVPPSRVSLLKRLLAAGLVHEFGRDIIADWARRAARPDLDPFSVLDIGCGEGADLAVIRQALPGRRLRLAGLDTSAHHVRHRQAEGIDAHCLDIERAPFPFADRSFDFVVANQVLEHTKEIFWILSEASRILKTDGLLGIGVPNLAALHNRLFLLAGRQPVCLRNLGPHVRGFTAGDFRDFLGTGGVFTPLEVRGTHVHPFPPALGRPLGRLIPGLSTSIFLLARRTGTPALFGNILKSIRLETNFYQGPEAVPSAYR